MKIYYFAHMITQFAQIFPVFERLGGKLLITHPFYSQYLKSIFRFGPGKTKFFVKEHKIPEKIRGIFISQIPRLPFEDKKNNLIKIYSGHGVSDKKFSATLKVFKADMYDFYFLSGNKDLERLELMVDDNEELRKRVIKIGLLRSDRILNNEVDLKKLKEKYNILNDKKNILYAPTWKYGGGTIRKCFYNFSKSLNEKFNLIVRPHYFDHKLFKKHKKFLKENRLNNVRYITKPDIDITELFHISDLLISDNSSIEYEYLLTGKPIIRVAIDKNNYISQSPEYDINTIVFKYNSEADNIISVIEEALTNKDNFRKKAEIMSKNCFFFNDGKAVERMCKLILAIQNNNHKEIDNYKLDKQ